MKRFFILLFLFSVLFASAQFNTGKYWNVGFIQATDPDSGPEVIYSITAGNSAGYFLIMPCSGIVKVDTAIYDTFVRQKTIILTFKIADPEGKYIKTTGKIILYKDAGVKRKPTVIGLNI